MFHTVKKFINNLLLPTGYQIAKTSNLLAFEGAERRKLVNEWILSEQPSGKILDIGAGPTSFVSTHFPDVTTFDQQGEVDITGDLHTLSALVVSNSFDTVICTEVFEHTRDPLRAIKEIHNVLKPGGKFIGSAPCSHELHGEEYGDYWRITPQGWEHILSDFTDVKIKTMGVYPQIQHIFVSGYTSKTQ